MRRRSRTPILLGLLLVFPACTAPDATGPLAPPDAAFAVNGAGRISLYGAGVPRAVPGSPCRRPEHRQFDFWIGAWDVTTAAGPAGTNIVESLLDGCVIQENWVGAGGGRGRSINAYDLDTGLWHQTWVSAFDTGHLRMDGGWNGSIMALDGVRTQPNGVQWIDSYTWTPQGPDQLVQAGRLQIPVANIDIQFALAYTRVADVVPAPELPTVNCLAGRRSSAIRNADFWLGRWNVRRANGQPLGTAEVVSDLSGCLTIETFRTPKGYASIAYLYFDLIENRMYRTIIDSEGERMEQSGAFAGTDLVLQAVEPAPGGAAWHVRSTLAPISADIVMQRFEVSTDGVSWRPELLLYYERNRDEG